LLERSECAFPKTAQAHLKKVVLALIDRMQADGEEDAAVAEHDTVAEVVDELTHLSE